MNLDLNKVHHLDAIEMMKQLPDNSIDSVVTDPPYGLSEEPDIYPVLQAWMNDKKYVHKSKGFMNRVWDSFVPGPEYWRECFRVLKPGGNIAVFGGTRTFDLISIGLRMAGFEKRDTLMFLFGTGFPKSMDISKKIDEKLGHDREVVGLKNNHISTKNNENSTNTQTYGKYGNDKNLTAPSSNEAKKYEGFGTAIKPAYEPILLCRKPIEKGLTVAENCMKWGTGGLNIDGCRVETDEVVSNHSRSSESSVSKGKYGDSKEQETHQTDGQKLGRFPANIIHDGSDEVIELFPDTGKSTGGRTIKRSGGGNVGSGKLSEKEWSNDDPGFGDNGSAARFFYSAKASKGDRDEGLDNFEFRKCGMMEDDNYEIKTGSGNLRNTIRKNHHPTVKPTSLMMWLCRLVTPAGGTVLDPFSGSGSTGKAAMIEGFNFIGSDLEPDFVEISNARILHAKNNVESLRKKYSGQVDKILPKQEIKPSNNNFF